MSALAADAVTGIVAGVGAGGIVALRADDAARLAVAGASAWSSAAVYTFVLARTAGAVALLAGADLPLHRPSASPTTCPSVAGRGTPPVVLPRLTWSCGDHGPISQPAR